MMMDLPRMRACAERRHLGRFIPGRPNIVVRNMEGAAGIVSIYLDRHVVADGLTLAFPGALGATTPEVIPENRLAGAK